jgi:hypothetical protein
MPGLLQMLIDDEEELEGVSSEVTNPEDVKLWLPSSVPAHLRQSVCMDGLPEIEERLRTAQCGDAIQSLRHTLRVKSRMVLFKNANIVGQRPSLRSRAIIDRVHERAKKSANRYRLAREAKKRLVGEGEWEKELPELKDEDVRSYRDQARFKKGAGRRGITEDSWEPREEANTEQNGAEGENGDGISLWTEVWSERNVTQREDIPRDGMGETHKTTSWIWTSGPGLSLSNGTDEGNEVCRSEWCRSRARAKRATEEVMLLKEEMQRTIRYLEWKEKQWGGSGDKRNREEGIEPGVLEGLSAYASKQVSLYRHLAIAFRSIWMQPLSTVEANDAEAEEDNESDSDSEWEEDYNEAEDM